ncbi:hypothetical protein SMGD1_2832 [Sulfurimonas gotlandica GD1]|uniref:Periplasmic protein n=1 Tax=Sulfurimonas gotlandica (strain DSM 19862 / JCM 16533 / GD1) TaxID=929558 RepID=B6BJV4_SULGG|nr:hypothetical protein [Sulfurimonas gotlandica]EDZ62510.1 hypothetical protein CBGD1_2077 [Sulfurimonas gotlandica GD1]EHP31354.1 hypothetical protein SMGD1_2832 [Sulfurimonas gotlandica GD1]
MKTIQLLMLLLGAITLSAQEIQNDYKKCGSEMKIQKAKQENAKDEAKNSVDSRFSPKAYQKTDWTREIPTDNHDYPRGKIRTH